MTNTITKKINKNNIPKAEGIIKKNYLAKILRLPIKLKKK